MGIESKWIWMDGALVPFEDATTHVLSHTLHYGLGAFEGIRAYEQPDGRAGVWRLDEHLERLLNSVAVIRHTLDYSLADLRAACLEVLRANEFSSAYIRPLVFLGAGQMGLGARGNKVHVVIAAWSWGAYLGEEGLRRGVNLKTSSFTRSHPNASMPRAKVVGHYVNSILARYEANEDGYDEALMLDHTGLVAEGTGENIFMVEGNLVTTPPPTNILPGLTRKTVMEIVDHLPDLRVVEQSLGRDGLYMADEAFMVGTAAEVTPIATLDHRAIGNGARGPVTERIQSIYQNAVAGRVDWLARHITPA
ncbi:MAG: branched-chain amino acid aminotransferase [Myxococcota bacterium]|jgi:branched-chain amino acid aminotransferase